MILQRLKRNAAKNRQERPLSFAIGILLVVYGIGGLVSLLVFMIL